VLSKNNLNIKDFIQIVKKFEPVYIQYRNKSAQKDKIISSIKELKGCTNTKIIINDHFDLMGYCDGLHIGQEDIKKLQISLNINEPANLFKLIRKLHKNKIIGISTKTNEQILQANSFDIDYIGIGAYKDTTTKKIDKILGKNISYMAKISNHKTCAIGGVKIDDNIKNIDYLAICSGLLKTH